MAPSAKTSSQSNDDVRTRSVSPNISVEERNVTYGVNYSIPSVEAFVPFERQRAASDCVESCGKHMERTMNDTWSNLKEEKKRGTSTASFGISDDTPIRKSSRQPKPRRRYSNPGQYEKSRVRYDINLVPMVKKNPEFHAYWRDRWNNVDNDGKKRTKHSQECNTSNKENVESESPSAEWMTPSEETVLWIPQTRDEWEDCLSEMTALCKSASIRRHFAESSKPPLYSKPLSRDYIRDRVDIDDPLIGYQFRHKTGGWLQGFLMFTNFTTWSHYFKWDSKHVASGVPGGKHLIDADGSLAEALENEPRSGDPLAGGVVFSSVAEIGLVGGLGCGEYLLRMALDDIRFRDQYQYVVLQATDASRAFYEKFGFVRVGAISKYGPRVKGRRLSTLQTSDEALSDVVGYRHWTYAHESEQSLGKHGGPSYMMAMKVERGGPIRDMGSFLEAMKLFAIPDKPRIKQLGAAQTPASKKAIISTSVTSVSPIAYPLIPAPPLVPTAASSTVLGKKVRGRPRKRFIDESTSNVGTVEEMKKGPGRPRKQTSEAPPLSVKLAPVNGKQAVVRPRKHEAPKRAKISAPKRRQSSYQFMEERNKLLTPPPPGKGLTYAQKQYQSVWLAVSPKVETATRRPPRVRKIST